MARLGPGDFIAGYAAVVATAALGWQIWNSYRAKRPQVTLLLDNWRSSQAGSTRSLESADVRIRNREDYAVRVDRLYFRLSNTLFSKQVAAEVASGDVGRLPFEVPARDVVSLTLRPSKSIAWYARSGTSTTQSHPKVVMELRTGERYGSRA